MKYRLASDNTILSHTEVPPVLKIVDEKYFDFEGNEYILVPSQDITEVESEVGFPLTGVGILGLLAVIGLVLFMRGRKS